MGHRVADDYVFEGEFAGYRATLGDRTKPMLEWDAETVADAGDTLKKRSIVDKNLPPCQWHNGQPGRSDVQWS